MNRGSSREVAAGWEKQNVVRRAKEALIDECARQDEEDHPHDADRFEAEITSYDPNISHEQAMQLYATMATLHELHRRAVYEFTTPTREQFHVILALGYDLMRLLTRRGTIPALLSCRGYDTIKYESLTHPPPELLGPSLLEEFFYEGGYTGEDIHHALQFAHDVIDWNTNYYRKNRDVGVIPPDQVFGLLEQVHRQEPKRILDEKDIRAVFRTEKSAIVEQANYLVLWRTVPFTFFKMITQTRGLDLLPLKSRSYQISRIIKRCVDEIIPPGAPDYGYYNRMIIEEPPRRLQALEVLYLLKEHYAMRPDQDVSLRDSIHEKFYALIEDPRFKYYYDVEARKEFRNLIWITGDDYEFE